MIKAPRGLFSMQIDTLSPIMVEYIGYDLLHPRAMPCGCLKKATAACADGFVFISQAGELLG